MMSRIFVFVIFIYLFNVCQCQNEQLAPATVTATKWKYKYSLTKNSNSQITINCEQNDQIWIGWSHYGTTAKSQDELNENLNRILANNGNLFNMLNENDCWMNFTEKIAEQCNGASQCDISSQPTYIHKCAKISDYIYVSYICYESKDTVDICKRSYMEKTKSNDKLLITSPEFPHDYPPMADCTCVINSNNQFNLEVLWFSLQDNDFLSVSDKSLTNWLNPTLEYPIQTKNVKIRFQTDDSLAFNGFWLKVKESKSCKSDWQLVGDNCIKVFSEPLDWRSANNKCQLMNGYLVKIDDVIGDLKFTQYMNTYYPEIQSYWIGLRKYVDETNKEKWMWSNSMPYNDTSWWPWKRTVAEQQQKQPQANRLKQNCVVKRKNEDGFFSVVCDNSNKYSFICQADNDAYTISNSKITVQCGQTDYINQQKNLFIEPLARLELNTKQTDQQTTPPTMGQASSSFTTQSDKIKVIVPLEDNGQSDRVAQLADSSTVKTDSKYNNTTIIAGMISGVGLVILLLNVLLLVICRRNLKNLIKSAKHGGSGQPDELSQEYFDTFVNTIQHTRPRTATSSTSNDSTQLQQQQHLTVTTNKKPLILTDADLNDHHPLALHQQQQQQQILLIPFQHDLLLRQSSNGTFKPITTDELLSQQQQQHQYDKMSHLRVKQLSTNEFNSNYSHTYECLDALDMPFQKRVGTVHLGLSGRNYKTLTGHEQQQHHLPPQSPLLAHITQQQQQQQQQNFLFLNPHISQQSDLSNFNTTTSSSDSSTHQFIRSSSMKPTNNKNKNLLHTFAAQMMITGQQQQTDVNTKSNFIQLSNNNGVSSDSSCSPDSAYYSSIPTSNGGNYTFNYNQFAFLTQDNTQNSSKNDSQLV